MTNLFIGIAAAAAILVLLYLATSIVRQYEGGIVLRFGPSMRGHVSVDGRRMGLDELALEALLGGRRRRQPLREGPTVVMRLLLTCEKCGQRALVTYYRLPG